MQSIGSRGCSNSCRLGMRRLPELLSGRDFWRSVFQTVPGRRERQNSSRSSRGT